MKDITLEGDIYTKLNQHQVPNIPMCHVARDIGNDFYHMLQTHLFNPTYGSIHLTTHLVPHWHHCLILNTVCRRLEIFKYS